MAEVDFDGLVEQARSLPREEQQRLRDLLALWLSRPKGSQSLEPPTEEQLDEELLIQGVLDRVPPPLKDRPPREDPPLVEIKGKPLSETIIEDRR